MTSSKAALLASLFTLSAVQLIRPAKNLQSESPSLDVFARHPAPGNVRRVVQAACYDCHSNATRYPWYAEIQPAGWLLASHVSKGKRNLNFSAFGRLSARDARKSLEAVADEVADGRMPLRSYTWAHPEARITPADADAIVAWANRAAAGLGAAGTEP